MNLEEFVGKKVRIFTEKSEYIGKVIGYTQAIDNEPEVASIDVRNEADKTLYELYENEIKGIEVLN